MIIIIFVIFVKMEKLLLILHEIRTTKGKKKSKLHSPPLKDA